MRSLLIDIIAISILKIKILLNKKLHILNVIRGAVARARALSRVYKR